MTSTSSSTPASKNKKSHKQMFMYAYGISSPHRSLETRGFEEIGINGFSLERFEIKDTFLPRKYYKDKIVITVPKKEGIKISLKKFVYLDKVKKVDIEKTNDGESSLYRVQWGDCDIFKYWYPFMKQMVGNFGRADMRKIESYHNGEKYDNEILAFLAAKNSLSRYDKISAGSPLTIEYNDSRKMTLKISRTDFGITHYEVSYVRHMLTRSKPAPILCPNWFHNLIKENTQYEPSNKEICYFMVIYAYLCVYNDTTTRAEITEERGLFQIPERFRRVAQEIFDEADDTEKIECTKIFEEIFGPKKKKSQENKGTGNKTDNIAKLSLVQKEKFEEEMVIHGLFPFVGNNQTLFYPSPHIKNMKNNSFWFNDEFKKILEIGDESEDAMLSWASLYNHIFASAANTCLALLKQTQNPKINSTRKRKLGEGSSSHDNHLKEFISGLKTKNFTVSHTTGFCAYKSFLSGPYYAISKKNLKKTSRNNWSESSVQKAVLDKNLGDVFEVFPKSKIALLSAMLWRHIEDDYPSEIKKPTFDAPFMEVYYNMLENLKNVTKANEYTMLIDSADDDDEPSTDISEKSIIELDFESESESNSVEATESIIKRYFLLLKDSITAKKLLKYHTEFALGPDEYVSENKGANCVVFPHQIGDSIDNKWTVFIFDKKNNNLHYLYHENLAEKDVDVIVMDGEKPTVHRIETYDYGKSLDIPACIYGWYFRGPLIYNIPQRMGFEADIAKYGLEYVNLSVETSKIIDWKSFINEKENPAKVPKKQKKGKKSRSI